MSSKNTSRSLRPRIRYRGEDSRNEILTADVLPFDTLVFIRHSRRALQRAMRLGDLASGTLISRQLSQLPHTEQQAQAVVDQLPRTTQISLYHEQVERMDAQLMAKAVPPDEAEAFAKDCAYYSDRLNQILDPIASSEQVPLFSEPGAA